MDDKITVIIPTFNRAQYIERAIDSVLNQTYRNIELIVVDDNDNQSKARKDMIKKMKKYEDDKRVRYIKHSKNKNGAAARNTGIRNATGKYITFLDDDDYFFPNRLEHMIIKLKLSNDSNAIYSSVVITRKQKIIDLKRAKQSGNLQFDILKQNSFFGTGSNIMFTADSLKKIKGFDESFLRNQDLEVMVRFFEENKIECLDEILVVKNIDDRSNSSNFEKVFTSRLHFIDNFKSQIEKYNTIKKQEIYTINFLDLCRFAVKSNKKISNVHRVIKEAQKTSCKIDFIFVLKIVMYFINSIIPLKILLDHILSKKYSKTLPSNELEFIKSTELDCK